MIETKIADDDLIFADLPHTVQVEITSNCNLACTMCPLTTQDNLSSLNPGHITEKSWQEIIPVAKKTGRITIAGFGEPLVNPQCLPLLQELNDLGIKIGMSTNGTALTPKIATKLASLPHLIHINISIDSPDPQIYQAIRGGDLQKALTGVENLMSVIDDPYRVTVSSVMMSQNLPSLVNFPAVLSKLGVKHYILQGLIHLNASAHDQNLLYHTNTANFLDELKQACQLADIQLEFTLPNRLDLQLKNPPQAKSAYYTSPQNGDHITKQCCLPWEHPFVDKNGTVFPCCFAATSRQAVLGSLDKDSLLDIWHGEPYQLLRQQMLNGDALPDVCQSCTAVPIGVHPLRQFAAKICYDKSIFQSDREIRLVVQNIGTATWTQATFIRVGTTRPKGRHSTCYHPDWLNHTRPTSFQEKVVTPGEMATFIFPIVPTNYAPSENFQLVVDGTAWLPNTQFEIRPIKSNKRRFGSSLNQLKGRILERGKDNG